MDESGKITDRIADRASAVAGQAAAAAGPLAAQAKEKASRLAGQAAAAAGPLATQAKERASDLAEKAGPIAAQGVGAVGQNLDRVTHGKYSDRISKMTSKLEQRLHKGTDENDEPAS